jgi:ABC-2 type transport system permease protein
MTTLPKMAMKRERLEDEPRLFRAWCYLVWLCIQRQARARQMLWIALSLLALSTTFVALNGASGRWSMRHWRMPRGSGPTFQEIDGALAALPLAPAASALRTGYEAVYSALLAQSGFAVFANWMVFTIFLSFLLPIWSLSFATDAFGNELEGGTLIWLMSLPLPRPAIYLAKFVALLPVTLAFNFGGFALLCLAAGTAGHRALQLFWPSVLWGSMAFTSLFHLMGASFRRSAVTALVYSFFLETILGNMPGTMKRISIGYYVRCMMFEEAQAYGLQPEKPQIYLPVASHTALAVLLGLTLVFLVAGMFVFSTSEYREAS